ESEAFNEEINNLYNLNAVRITIGNIYNHTRHYNKAIAYFTQAKNYYQSKKDYNHLRSYIVTLYCLSKTYWQLQDIDKLTTTIKESEQAIKFLKPKDKQLETAYLEYAKGGLAFLQKNNVAAQQHFTKALPAIQQNGDFTNEHVMYLYLGKILWQQNQKAEAMAYFTKIDTLFHEKKFLNYELRETYDYLIAYYNETNQPQLQLKATESLMQLNRQFEQEQKNITNMLHVELDDKKLKNNQLHLQKLLNKYNFWISVLGGALLIIAAYLFWKKYKKSPYPAEKMLKIIEQNQTAESTDSKTTDNDAVKIEKTETIETESVDENLTEIPEQQPQEQKVAVL